MPAVPADPQNPVSVLSYSWAMRTPGWIVDLRALFCPRRPECRQGCDVSPTGPPPRLSATWLTSSGKDDMVWYGHHLLGAQLRGLRGQEGREGWEARPGRQTEGSSRVQNWVTGPTSPRGKALQTGKWPQKGGTQGDPARFRAPCPQPAPSRRTLWDLVGSPCPTVVAGAQHCECAKFTQWCSALPTLPGIQLGRLLQVHRSSSSVTWIQNQIRTHARPSVLMRTASLWPGLGCAWGSVSLRP